MTLGVLASGFVPLAHAEQGRRVATGYIRTNWSRDPYSLGSYSYVAKGAQRRHHAVLGEPFRDRLFFAGEATHPNYNSSVHAAYESGIIAAEAVFETDANTVGIVGAGASGLTAATALVGEGYDVTVLEARDRIGGRIWTDNSLGTPFDLGASWIHGADGNPLTDLAGSLGLEMKATSKNYIVRGGDGRRIDDADVPEWLENVVSVQHTAGADMNEINSLAYWRDSDYGGDEVILPGGYDQLLNAVPDNIDIRLGHVVTNVVVEENSVQLQDQTGQHHSFDAMILTTSLGVLKNGAIAFSPPLPREKVDAIVKLGMGTLDKVYLRYDEVFWDADVTWIATPENGLPQGQFNQWFNLVPYTGQPVIMALNGAQPALDLSELPDAEIVKRAQQTLELAYP
ncbi:FAD-dependent oxidoreductase [Roseibium sp. HPY-6]|uniref:flavin monoamine oxidase family protein n=1 Tax=Roseibium sp. HPY-6 TaxID=3229852 RepID=UPI00338F992B